MSELIFENGPKEKIKVPGAEESKNGKPQGMAVLNNFAWYVHSDIPIDIRFLHYVFYHFLQKMFTLYSNYCFYLNLQIYHG